MKKSTFSLFPVINLCMLVLVCNQYVTAQTVYNGKPRYEILCTQSNATLGIINIELYQNIAPAHVRNFDSLVANKFYDTTAFHRVVPGFVIQGGDPNSRHGAVNTWGYGQPGQPTVKAEFTAAKHLRGTLSAARSSNINSATSQFFVCVANTPNLDGSYSVYGRVTSGMTVVDAIVGTPTVVGTQRPVNKIEMFVRYIGLNDTVPQPPPLIFPKNDSTEVDTNVVTLKWGAVPGGLIYHVDIARDSLFTDTVKSADMATLQYNALYLPAKTKYYWKVKVNNGGFFKNSEIRHFTTAPKEVDLSGIGVNSGNSTRLVFPNPSRDRFTFTGLKFGDVIIVQDLAGRTVKEVTAQTASQVVDLQSLPPGAYLYEVRSSARKVDDGRLVIER